MKTVLITIGVLLALVGVLSIVQYVRHQNATVTIEKTSLLPKENMASARGGSAYGGEETKKFTPLTQVESDGLAMKEDRSLLGLTAGAFNPRFAPLSDSEQNTLNSSAQQNPEMQNMTAGNLDSNAGLGNASWGTVLLVILGLVILF